MRVVVNQNLTAAKKIDSRFLFSSHKFKFKLSIHSNLLLTIFVKPTNLNPPFSALNQHIRHVIMFNEYSNANKRKDQI